MATTNGWLSSMVREAYIVVALLALFLALCGLLGSAASILQVDGYIQEM